MIQIHGKKLYLSIASLSLPQFLFTLAGSRLALLIALRLITHGHELANDVSMHMDMVRSPLSVILYTIPAYEQHPPFLPFLEAVIAYPLQRFTSDFLAIRCLMISYEIALGYIFYRLLQILSFSKLKRASCIVAFICLPTGWMTTTVMGQDDSIAACAFLLPLLFYVKDRKRIALLLAGIGVIAAKLFVILELINLIPLTRFQKKPRKLGQIIKPALIGFSPIIAVYGIIAISRLKHAQPLPLLGFRPDPYFGTNFWMVLQRQAGINLHKVSALSGFIALLAATIPSVLLTLRRGGKVSHRDIILCTGCGTLLFFSLFYHVEPEYFTIVMPVLLLGAETVTDAVSLSLIAFVVWAGKFFQNASFHYKADLNSGKEVASHLFISVFHSSPLAWLTTDQLFFSLLTLYVGGVWINKLRLPATRN